MLRHIYDRLEVTGDLTAVFDPKAKDALEKAVEYLRRVHHPVSDHPGSGPPRQPTTPSPETGATPPLKGGELNPATPPQTRRGAKRPALLIKERSLWESSRDLRKRYCSLGAGRNRKDRRHARRYKAAIS